MRVLGRIGVGLSKATGLLLIICHGMWHQGLDVYLVSSRRQTRGISTLDQMAHCFQGFQPLYS